MESGAGRAWRGICPDERPFQAETKAPPAFRPRSIRGYEGTDGSRERTNSRGLSSNRRLALEKPIDPFGVSRPRPRKGMRFFSFLFYFFLFLFLFFVTGSSSSKLLSFVLTR